MGTVHDTTCVTQEDLESQKVISLLTELLSSVRPPVWGTALKKTQTYIYSCTDNKSASPKGIITLMLAGSNYWKGNQVSQTGWSVAIGTVLGISIARVLKTSSAGLIETLQTTVLLNFYKPAVLLCNCPSMHDQMF